LAERTKNRKGQRKYDMQKYNYIEIVYLIFNFCTPALPHSSTPALQHFSTPALLHSSTVFVFGSED
jgi:hypothetical protein